MLILLILLAVAGLTAAVIAYRADNDDPVSLKDKASLKPFSVSVRRALYIANGLKRKFSRSETRLTLT